MGDEAKPNVRYSGPVEGARGNREVPPTNPGAPEQEVDELAEPRANIRESGPVEGDPGNREVPPAEQEDLRRERDEYLDTLRRVQAEFANYRKRVARDQGSLVARAAERLVKELIPVLDDLERALEAANEHEEAKLEEGVRLVHRSFADALAKEGLVEIETDGKFDPHTQEALLAQPSDEEEGTVIQVLQKGYRLGDRVLRPARVVVAGAPAVQPPVRESGPVEGDPREPGGSSGEPR